METGVDTCWIGLLAALLRVLLERGAVYQKDSHTAPVFVMVAAEDVFDSSPGQGKSFYSIPNTRFTCAPPSPTL